MTAAQRSRQASSERAVIERALAFAAARARAAYDPEARWVDRVRGGLQALLEAANEQPELARLCVARALVGRGLHPRLDWTLDELAQIIDQGRAASAVSKQRPSCIPQSVLGGALGLIYARLVSRDGRSLVELRNPLMATIVLPYLGHAAARREQFRREPAGRLTQPMGERSSERPERGIRLTYRTMRVLAAIAAQSALSNSEVAERSRISDQGQVSKLLSRLKLLGLIENTAAGQARGATNAWRLTREGEECLRKIGRVSVYAKTS